MKSVRAKKKTWKAGSNSEAAQRRPPALPIPSILLEGDAPGVPSPVQPVQRFSIIPPAQVKPAAQKQAPAEPIPSPQPASAPVPEQPTISATAPPCSHPAATRSEPFPEAYGTKRLMLVPRDPHWVYAHWDMTRGQLEEYNRLSREGHLVLRIFQEYHPGSCKELPVHPESRNWFVRVEQPGATYRAELGYYPNEGPWIGVCSSDPVSTPPAGLSENTSVRFQTLEPDLLPGEMVKLASRIALQDPAALPTLKHLPPLAGTPSAHVASFVTFTGSSAQDQLLGELIRYDESRRIGMGSLEITELLRRVFRKEVPVTPGQGQPGEAWSGEIVSISSPAAAPGQKKFWFNVNAELVIYGATEPDAKVMMGGRQIQLRPDGTFSFRFALPDGHYTLPAQATSADGTDSRGVVLQFSRHTQSKGDVGKHPQAAHLKTPSEMTND